MTLPPNDSKFWVLLEKSIPYFFVTVALTLVLTLNYQNGFVSKDVVPLITNVLSLLAGNKIAQEVAKRTHVEPEKEGEA